MQDEFTPDPTSGRVFIRCRHCGVRKLVWRSVARARRYCSLRCYALAMRRPAIDGSRKDAGRAVARAVRDFVLPLANHVACTDCGKLWQDGEPSHQYDHYLGYAVANWLDVQAVCPPCHYARSVARGSHDPRRLARTQNERKRIQYGPYPRTCLNCGATILEKSNKGRCNPCGSYFGAHGKERPPGAARWDRDPETGRLLGARFVPDEAP